jgi:pimeloyl-ACP methyl ester carboxylesterase
VLALAGGPGESAVPLLLDSLGSVAPALRSRDLLTFDQRGTGGSGLLRCASFERLRIGTLRDAARRCAK